MYDLAFVMRGRIRRELLKRLEEPKTAVMLSKLVDKHRESVSRALIALEGKGFVTCLNPKDAMHRFYRITPKGKKTLGQLAQLSIG